MLTELFLKRGGQVVVVPATELEIYAKYVILGLQAPQSRILALDKSERAFRPVALLAHNSERPAERGLGRGNQQCRTTGCRCDRQTGE